VKKEVCELEGALYSSGSLPKGVLVEIVLSSKSGEIIGMYPSAPGADAGSPESVDNGSVTTQKIDFPTPSLDKFTQYRYRIFLQAAKSMTNDDCEVYAKKIKVSVQPISR
jgi:hypothetical protein